jgi:hypothetical protein
MNFRLHAIVVRAFAKVDPYGRLYISPDIIAEGMWRVIQELAARKINEPKEPFWMSMKSDDDERKEKSDERRALEELYREELVHYDEIFSTIAGNVVNSYGYELAKKATKELSEQQSGYRPGSLEAFVHGAVELYRNRNGHTQTAREKRQRYLHEVLTALQVTIARENDREYLTDSDSEYEYRGRRGHSEKSDAHR